MDEYRQNYTNTATATATAAMATTTNYWAYQTQTPTQQTANHYFQQSINLPQRIWSTYDCYPAITTNTQPIQFTAHELMAATLPLQNFSFDQTESPSLQERQSDSEELTGISDLTSSTAYKTWSRSLEHKSNSWKNFEQFHNHTPSIESFFNIRDSSYSHINNNNSNNNDNLSFIPPINTDDEFHPNFLGKESTNENSDDFAYDIDNESYSNCSTPSYNSSSTLQKTRSLSSSRSKKLVYRSNRIKLMHIRKGGRFKGQSLHAFQRQAANMRERRRMQSINKAFEGQLTFRSRLEEEFVFY
ncbi:unnamed protein product [Trichobilharzia regenti]|nr:unnamed protein product [Trichobilharzia regenti]